jgi:uncharacterized protein YjbI with pentapeptide repeats
VKRRGVICVLLACAALAFGAPAASAGCGSFAGADCHAFDLDGLAFSNIDAPGSDFYLTQFVDATLTDFDIPGSFIGAANFTGARITGGDFTGMNPGLHSATQTLFDSAYVRNTSFSGNLQWTQFIGADLQGVDFSGADLSNADFDAANLSGADFSGADLTGAQLDGAVLNGTNFSNANLSFANLDSAGAANASFRGATMLGAQMTGMLADGADFTGAAIFRADLSYMDLSQSTIDFYKLPTTSLGPSWKYVSSFLPRIIDVAGYTCNTRLFPETREDESAAASGGTDPTIDNNDCTITITAISNALQDVAGLFTGGDEIEVAVLVRKIIQDLASAGFDATRPEVEPWLTTVMGQLF